MSAPKIKDYVNNFEKQADGKYVYKGAHYLYGGSPESRKKNYTVLFALLGALIAVVLGSGFVTAGGMKNTFYVIIPYIGEAAALFASAWYSFKLLTKGDRVRDYVYLSTGPKIPNAFTIVAFFAIAGFLCSLYYSVTNRFTDGVIGAVIYLLLKALSVVLALLFKTTFQKLEWIKE